MSAPKFDEARVVRFCRYDTVLELELDDVLVDGQRARVALAVSQVSSVMIDGEISNAPLMATNDGEVLTLEISEDGLSLIVEWNDFRHGKSFIRSYRVAGDKVSISAK